MRWPCQYHTHSLTIVSMPTLSWYSAINNINNKDTPIMINEKCIFGYVAIEIEIIEDNDNPNEYLPITPPPILRQFKGEIVVSPLENSDGFIYNASVNNMCRIESTNNDYSALERETCVRYNEAKLRIENADNDESEMRDEYRIIATDLVTVHRVSAHDLDKYYASDNFTKYRSK